jgi:hypothetical protein
MDQPLKRAKIHRGVRRPEKLTALKLKTVVRAGKGGRWGDGRNLSLVSKTGRTFFWEFTFRRNGKSGSAGLGSLQDGIGLVQARARAVQCRITLADGKDPRADRKAVQQAPSVPTMESCIGQYTALMAARWSPSTQRQWRASRLSTPTFLAKPVTEVATADIVDVFHERTPVVRARIIKRLETIFDWLIATGVRQEPNPARFKLGHYLQQPKLLTVHHAAIPWSDLPAYMRTLRERESFAAACLALQILTAVRPGEAREAAWSEIDDEAALWTIPASRMKARQEHRVPLAPQAVELLRRMAASMTSDFIFPGRAGPLNWKTVGKMVPPGVTAHGFRSPFHAGRRTRRFRSK